MGFNSVYRSLAEIFPQIDTRILRAVALEHHKDADEAAALVISEIVPLLPAISSHNSTQYVNKSCQASGSKSSASSSSETLPLVVGQGSSISAPSIEFFLKRNDELTKLPPYVGPGVCHNNAENEEVESFQKALGKGHENYDFLGKCFGVPSKDVGLPVPDFDLASMAPPFYQDSVKSANDIWQEICSQITLNQAELSGRIDSESAAQKLVDITPEVMKHLPKSSCFDLGTGSTNVVDETSRGSLAGENENAELGGASTHINDLEEIIENAKSNKRTMLTAMESVMNLMKEVELREKDAEKSKEEAVGGSLDMFEKVEELKGLLEHAKGMNSMRAGEVYGEKSILATEVKELENRLFNLSQERNKSLNVLDEMRAMLEMRLAAAMDMKEAAELEKKAKQDAALEAFAEQEAIMEKVVQESKLLQQEAKENFKLREFLMARGQVVDSLQGEISVICHNVKLLKEKFDNRVSLTKSISASQTSSRGSLVLDNLSEQLNGVLESSSSTKSTNEEEEEASFVNKEKDICRQLLEDGWDIFDMETAV